MRRPDEEPEARDDAPVPARRRPGGRLLVPLVVVGAAVVVLSTALEGRAHVTPFTSGTSGSLERPPAAESTSVATQAPPDTLGTTANSVVQSVLLVLACVVATVVAALLIRLLVSAIRARRRRVGPRRLRASGVGLDADVAGAPAVLRGIAAALVAFDEDREPGDAVVRAWLGLQQAAEDGGFARSPAETPTEFTGRVLTRTGADRAALRTLLALYLRARFADGAISPADAAEARAALRALEASWERVTAVSRG